MSVPFKTRNSWPLEAGNRVLVTGFGPFEGSPVNPSGRLAEASGYPHLVLDVTFEAVEKALADFAPFDTVLLLGVASRAAQFRAEHVAHNWIGSVPDVTGVRAGPGPIDPKLPFQLAGTLWPSPGESTELEIDSANAGDYLCNYLYFRALCTYPEKAVGFLHVPSAEHVPFETQVQHLRHFLGNNP
ncbi:MAG TPA: hypothetical protein PKA27_11520 [Fimbriimonadaceae bacterium]|nr:hypothetical protein [Fimbriimonadaceae bacterium]